MVHGPAAPAGAKTQCEPAPTLMSEGSVGQGVCGGGRGGLVMRSRACSEDKGSGHPPSTSVLTYSGDMCSQVTCGRWPGPQMALGRRRGVAPWPSAHPCMNKAPPARQEQGWGAEGVIKADALGAQLQGKTFWKKAEGKGGGRGRGQGER